MSKKSGDSFDSIDYDDYENWSMAIAMLQTMHRSIVDFNMYSMHRPSQWLQMCIRASQNLYDNTYPMILRCKNIESLEKQNKAVQEVYMKYFDKNSKNQDGFNAEQILNKLRTFMRELQVEMYAEGLIMPKRDADTKRL